MPAKKRSRPAASRRTPARKPARRAAPKPARRAAPKPARKPAARKPARKAASKPSPRKPARKPAPRVSRKPAPKVARKPARRLSRKAAAKPKRAVRAPKTRRRGVSTIPIPPARRRGPKRRRRAPKPAETSRRVVIEDEPTVAVVVPETPAEIADGERSDARRYVAVVSEIDGTEPFPAQEAPLFTPRERRAEVEAYVTDIPIALGAALLIASVFLPWYKGPKGFPLSISGWTSGTLAPLLVFLGAASLVLVALRRAGQAVSLPVEESLAHEGVGWLALVAAVVKTRWRPDVLSVTITPSYGVWIAIVAAALLVVFGGRMSPRAPLVMRPGWQRMRGGALGAALLIVVIAGSAVFGVVNSPSQNPRSPSNPQLFPGAVKGKLPDCAKDVPLPAGLKPDVGYDLGPTCQAQLTSKLTSPALIEDARKKLTAARWSFKETKFVEGAVQFTITKPRCGVMTILAAQSGSVLVFQYTSCPSATPTPAPSATSP